jgi:uncharacterized protein YkwD
MGKLKIIFVITLVLGGLYFLQDSRDSGGFISRVFGTQVVLEDTSYATSSSSTISGGINQIATSTASTTVEGAVMATGSVPEFVVTEPLNPSVIIQMTNVERLKKGLKPVLMNSNLTNSAQSKLQDLFTKQYFEHISPTGVGVSDLAREFGYDYVVVGENLALGTFKSNKDVVAAWMASPGHRANILDGRYQDIGVAVGYGKFQGSMEWIAVQHFGKPISACAQIDPNMKTQIDANKVYVTSLELKISDLKSQIDKSTGAAYTEKAEEYNEMVRDYNTRIISLQEDVANYNKSVADFNSCIGTRTVN